MFVTFLKCVSKLVHLALVQVPDSGDCGNWSRSHEISLRCESCRNERWGCFIFMSTYNGLTIKVFCLLLVWEWRVKRSSRDFFQDRLGSAAAWVSWSSSRLTKQCCSCNVVHFRNRSGSYSSYLGQVEDREPLCFSFSPEAFVSVFADESPECWMCKLDPLSKAFVQQQ